MIIFYLSKRSL